MTQAALDPNELPIMEMPDISAAGSQFDRSGTPITPFLASTDVIDWRDPRVSELARRLRADMTEQKVVAQSCFEWVRDNIQHSVDFARREVTCSASETLEAETGFCYAKSHLLAALLRANDVPAGFCYQRLSVDGDGPPFCIHGLNAVCLKDTGWYRVDARGDKHGVSTDFSPPEERLAFAAAIPGEVDFPEIWSEPLPIVVDALRSFATVDALQRELPDVPIIGPCL